MARVARLDGTGVCHHVLLRGIERREIFHDDVDRSDFVSRLRRQLSEGYGSCLGWVLMSNHVHLILRTGIRSLSSVMRRLNGGYARSFNRRHGRSGYLFQDRFRSILVQDDAYLLVLIRYVHLNPLRAGMVGSLAALEQYPWGGHAELMNGATAGLIAKDEILGHFGATRGAARRSLTAWMHAGESLAEAGEYRPVEANSSYSAQLDEDAPRNDSIVWEPSGISEPTPPEVRANQLRNAGWTLDALILWACQQLSADPAGVRGGRRTLRESEARAVISALATRDLGLAVDRVARATGVTAGAVCHAVERGNRVAKESDLRLDEQGPPEQLNYSTPSPQTR